MKSSKTVASFSSKQNQSWNFFSTKLNHKKETCKSLNTRSISLHNREEIRKQLALEYEELDKSDPWRNLIAKKTMKPSHHVCCFNESFDDTVINENEEDIHSYDKVNNKKEKKPEINKKVKLFEYFQQLNKTKSFPKIQELSNIQAILAKHFEKQKYFNYIFNPYASRRLNKSKLNLIALKSMSIPKLQIIVNNFHSQIEELNEKLVKVLLERDELYMEQDSLLMDIQDQTAFLMKKMKKSIIREPIQVPSK